MPGPPGSSAPTNQPKFQPSVKIPGPARYAPVAPKSSSRNKIATNPSIRQCVPHQDDARAFRRRISKDSTYVYNDVNYMEHLRNTVLQTPDGGQAKSKRESLTRNTTPIAAARSSRPVPGGGRPKPQFKQLKPTLPKAKALFPYTKADINEIGLEVGEIITIDHEDNSGWWLGTKQTGQKGYFPGAYVEKI